METQHKKLIACCGLDCGNCEARIATVNNDDALRRKVAAEWADMNNTSEITPESINCEGCLGSGVKFYYCSHLCQIRKCAIQRDLSSCAECPELDTCPKVGAIIGSNPDARDNLLSLKA